MFAEVVQRNAIAEVLEVIIVCVAAYFIIQLVRTTGKFAPDSKFKNDQLDDAHRFLFELEAADKLMNILPIELKTDLQELLKPQSSRKNN
jgi:hypothetical protein